MWTLGLACALLAALSSKPARSDNEAPSALEQAAMITAMRDYAAQYQAAMPNYVCTRIVRHFESGLKHIHWNKEGEEREELSVIRGEEHTTVAARQKRQFRLVTQGEFVAYLTQPLNASSEARFEWSGWDTIRGQRVATFTFAIDREHSTKDLSNFGVHAVVPYKGKVWTDPKTGVILRMWHAAEEIPSEMQVEKTATTVDYAPVSINGRASILPVLSVTEHKTTRRWIKNEIEFRGYREFQTDSTITFGPPSQP